MNEQDEMLQIDLCNGQVRVMLCETTETVQRCADIHESTPVCTAALGRLATGTLMLGMMMKGSDESVTVTIKGNGPMGTLVAVADHGYVRVCADQPEIRCRIGTHRQKIKRFFPVADMLTVLMHQPPGRDHLPLSFPV